MRQSLVIYADRDVLLRALWTLSHDAKHPPIVYGASDLETGSFQFTRNSGVVGPLPKYRLLCQHAKHQVTEEILEEYAVVEFMPVTIDEFQVAVKRLTNEDPQLTLISEVAIDDSYAAEKLSSMAEIVCELQHCEIEGDNPGPALRAIDHDLGWLCCVNIVPRIAVDYFLSGDASQRNALTEQLLAAFEIVKKVDVRPSGPSR